MALPRLLLVHGAFHGAWCWDRLTPELARVGIRHSAVELPFTSREDDVATVRRGIASSDEHVVVLGHSFAGAVISTAAAEGGEPYGATTSLIYLTAFMSTPDQTVDLSGAPGISEIQLDEDAASVGRAAAQSVFYNRCSEEDADWAAAQLRAMPLSVLMAPPAPSPAWQVLPSTYIICTDDRILSLSAQEQMAVNANNVLRIDSDHSPFLSCPKLLAESLRNIISEGP